MMAHEPAPGLRVERTAEGRVVQLTFDRPHRRNALDRATMKAFARAVAELDGDPDVRVVVVTAAGDKVFVAGGDLEDLHGLSGHAEGLEMADRMTSAIQRMASLPVPVLGAIEGSVYGGGCDLALGFDYRVVSRTARFAFRAARMGVMGGWGAPTRLVRLVGRSAATRLLLFDEEIAADEALRLGLVDEVAEPGGALPRVLELAARLEQAAPLAVRATKEALAAAEALPVAASLEVEKRLFARTWASEDHQEAVAAFRERRTPRWRGR